MRLSLPHFIFILMLGGTASYAQSQDSLSYRYEIGGAMSYAGFDKENNQSSRFQGLEYHLGFETKIKQGLFGKYDVGLLARLVSNDLKNKKNADLETETSTGTILEFGSRIYALNLFFGIGAAGGQKKIIYTDPDETLESKYADYGGYAEVGFVYSPFSMVYMTPFLKYRHMYGDPINATSGSIRSTYLDFGLSLGLSF